MNMNNKKQLTISIILILILILMIIGISYAAFQFTGNGNKVNTITTGAITMEYTESSNVINMTGALPTTDKTGMTRLTEGEYFDFTVKSSITGTANINWEISAKKLDNNTIDEKYIKLYLTKLNGSEEESLTAPLIYSEDLETNNYTGRPSNEMSLYTSNMSASEEGTYRLRMYVDESYNPQGDGGNLTFGIKINVYGKIGNKETPKTTTTILSANPVKETKEHMFNYASNGKQYDYVNKKELEADSNYITNGLYSAEDEDGTSYYFRGNVTNNNVQFGEYQEDYYIYSIRTGNVPAFQSIKNCQKYYSNSSSSNECGNEKIKLASKGDKMYWKIVRINGDGSLRLMYNGIKLGSTYNYSDISTWVGIGRLVGYNRNSNEVKSTGYTYDNGTDSVAKMEVDTWYKNSLGKTTYDKKIKSGRFCSDSSGYKKAIEYTGVTTKENTYYFSSMDRLFQFESNFAKDNAPSLICPKTTETFGGSYRLKAGLITADELVFGGESNGVTNDDFYVFSTGIFNLTVTSTPGLYDSSNAYIWRGNSKFDLTSVGNSAFIFFRPVINVYSDIDFISGDGSIENPYVLN